MKDRIFPNGQERDRQTWFGPGAMLLPVCLLLILVWAGTGLAITLTDQTGRRVEVPEWARRVVCLAPNLTEMVFALGVGDRVVGVSDHSNRPVAAASLPRVGSYVRPDVERIAALRPDLVLATRDGNPLEAVRQLEALAIPVLAVDPRSLEGVAAGVELVGRALGVTGRAEALAGEMRRRVGAVRQATAMSGSRPRVFYQIGSSPIVSVGRRSFVQELIETAGGQNVVRSDDAYPRLSLEDMVALAPEVVIVSTMGGEADVRAVRAELARWPSIPAVAAGRIHRVDSDLFDRPSPRLVEALETLAAILHPGCQAATGRGHGQ